MAEKQRLYSAQSAEPPERVVEGPGEPTVVTETEGKPEDDNEEDRG